MTQSNTGGDAATPAMTDADIDAMVDKCRDKNCCDSTECNCDKHADIIEALRKSYATAMQNQRETFDAMCAMRNDINEHIAMPSIESDLLLGPDNSVFCAAVAGAVVAAVAARPDPIGAAWMREHALLEAANALKSEYQITSFIVDGVEVFGSDAGSPASCYQTILELIGTSPIPLPTDSDLLAEAMKLPDVAALYGERE